MMDRHIQQTNDRLACIKQALSTPSGFQSAARELLEWCADPRAFQRPFETGLIGCLTVVSTVAHQNGFDLDLGYRLLAVCAAHRDKFSPKSAALLSRWCEDLGRLLLLRHQKNRSPDSTKGSQMHPQMQKRMTPVPADGPLGWPQGPPQQQQQGPGPQQVSVVTTVWGVTSTSQSGPMNHNTPLTPNTTMSGPNYMQGAYPQQKTGYSPQTPGVYPPTPNTPGSGPPSSQQGDFQPPPGALSAAAFVAAAATATATATAVALREQQQQDPTQFPQQGQHGAQYPQQGSYGSQQYNTPYNPSQMQPGVQQRPPMGMMPGSKPMYNQQGITSRPAPYPNHAQLMQRRQSQYGTNGPSYNQYPPAPFANQPQRYPSQSQPISNASYPPSQMPIQARMRHMSLYGGSQPNQYGQYTMQQSPMNGQGPGVPYHTQMPGNYGMIQHTQPGFQQNGPRPLSYQHSPIPGNPTPPITPGPPAPYMSPGPVDVKPPTGYIDGPDIKPQVPNNDELRLTFPVRDGVVLPPFRLEHNLAVSNHVFHLRQSVHQTLMWRSDLELQLKCFHHEDKQMNTNWPASVQVSVNAIPLTIERGENKTSHKPLYLKDICQPGRNTIQITVTACCCSHLFVLQLVHRPSVRSVLQGLLRKRLLPAEHCVTKIKRNFSNVATMPNGLPEDGVEQTAVKVSLKCPITYRRITLPARGHDCKHIQCFDLESYLQLNAERGSWRCPVCNKPAMLEGLEIDQYMWDILTKLANTEVEEITIDSSANWKPMSGMPLKGVKDEDPDSCKPPYKGMPGMPPANSMSIHGWEMGALSPYQPIPPDFSASSQGPGTPYNTSYASPMGSGGPGSNQNNSNNGDGFQGTADFMGPLSHLDSIVSGTDMLPVEKHLNHSHADQQMSSSSSLDMLRHPPGTPGSVPPPPSMTPTSQGNPASTAQGSSTTSTLADSSLPHPPDLGSDLNFDPAAVIDGDGNQDGLDLLPENLVDPMELLSYLGPSDISSTSTVNATSTTTTNSTSQDNSNNNNGNNTNPNTPVSSGGGTNTSSSDDLLALFDS